MFFSITFKKMSQAQTPLHLNGTLQKARIDWVLVSPHLRVTDARIIMDRFEDRYPSDHFPYMVDLSTSFSPHFLPPSDSKKKYSDYSL